MTIKNLFILGSALIIAGSIVTTPAAARTCEWHAFEVNDYGKEGPIRMARENLYKWVDNLKKEKRIKNVSVSERKPKCRLFLDFGIFDEHTCRIEAKICW